MLGDSANGRENHVPMVLTQPTAIQPAYMVPPKNTTPLPMPYIVQPPGPIVLPPALGPLTPAWPAITDLVVGREGRYQQSDQIPEVQACLRAAVRRANANLALLDGFPDPRRKGQWLADALGMELSECRNASTNMAAVDDRARRDAQYFNRLLYMVISFTDICRIAITTKKIYPRLAVDGAHSGRGSSIWHGQPLSLSSHHTAFMPQTVLILYLTQRYARPWHAIFSSRIHIILVKLQQ